MKVLTKPAEDAANLVAELGRRAKEAAVALRNASTEAKNHALGEAARLIFCRLMLQKPNFLMLDEPTNHLDLEAINALNFALQKYDGTVLLVTHDHDLVDEVATRIWHFENFQVEDFQGPYSEFLTEREAAAKR